MSSLRTCPGCKKPVVEFANNAAKVVIHLGAGVVELWHDVCRKNVPQPFTIATVFEVLDHPAVGAEIRPGTLPGSPKSFAVYVRLAVERASGKVPLLVFGAGLSIWEAAADLVKVLEERQPPPKNLTWKEILKAYAHYLGEDLS